VSNDQWTCYQPYGEIEDFLHSQEVSDKTKSNMKSGLHSFFVWVKRREKIPMPDFPEMPFELGFRKIIDQDTQSAIIDEVWRNNVTIEVQQAIIEEVKRISFDIEPKIWLGIKLLATYIKIRPGEMRNVRERDINLESGFIHIPHPKEGSRKQGRFAYLDAEDVDLIKSFPRSIDPDSYFFRHMATRSGIKVGVQFGPKCFKKWWDKACDNLGVKGVDLYGGTKHSTATALGEFLTPEEIKRGGTGSATNKAFERYFQPRRTESVRVVSTIKELQKKQAGKVIKMQK